MNFHEKNTRSMSSSLPIRSSFPEDTVSSESNRSYTIFSDSIKNPPKLAVSADDGSGTASNPKNIINNRRRSESFAVYSASDYLTTSSSNGSQNSFNELYLKTFTNSDENSSNCFSPEALQHHLFPQNLNVDKKIVLYKTEMCRTFEETGICKYGTKCQFAHDPNEIRNIPRHPRYKTEICKTFWQLGNCPYGKRCCFIHTENELREQKKTAATTTTASSCSDIYGSTDLSISEDVALNEIQSQNSSRSASPNKIVEAGKIAEDLKKAISNIGEGSIFNDLMSNRRKSDDKLDYDMTMLTLDENDSAAPNSKDPEFKTIYKDQFELWSCDSPNLLDDQETQAKTFSTNNKFTLFDKSPGSRVIDAFSNGIWSKPSLNTFIPDPQYFKPTEDSSNFSTVSSGSSSSKSHSNNHQQLLIDMLNLLDSS